MSSIFTVLTPRTSRPLHSRIVASHPFGVSTPFPAGKPHSRARRLFEFLFLTHCVASATQTA